MVEAAIERDLLPMRKANAAQTALALIRSNKGGVTELRVLAKALHSCLQPSKSLRRKHVVVTMGADGLVWATDKTGGSSGGGNDLGDDIFTDCEAVHQSSLPIDNSERSLPLDFNGAGDAFCGGLLAAVLQTGDVDEHCLRGAVAAARKRIMRHCQ